MFAKFWAWLLSLFGKTPTLPPGWNILYSPGMPAQMAPDAAGAFYFDFPQSDGVHYVTRPAAPVALGQTVTMSFAVVGDGKLAPTQGDPPARVRILLQERGDNLATPDARWWSTANAELTVPGEYTLTQKISPELWTTIGGGLPTAGAAGFLNCISALGNIGFTFGGMFAGHGVYAAGPSRFVLKSFAVA